MSIFKSTFKPSIQNQFRAREAVVSQAPKPTDPANVEYRDYNFHSYMSKNSWVRMSSFVDVNTKIGTKTYSDDELAKKYILEGGTLYVSGSNQYLRRGIYKKQGIYGSNIDVGSDVPLGLRPMPGISSIQVSNKSAYGSLREATVKFYCWDKHQLEELEVLYMRTGYSVLLEWGWSKYLDSTDLNNLKIKDFDQSGHIDIFYDKNKALKNNKDDDIYEAIDKQVNKSHGNYDAMLGYIKNFSWNLLPNGGFECTTVLISRGEILSALKINNNSVHIDFSSLPPPTTSKQATLSQFEKIFLNYMALINPIELKNEDSGSHFEEGEFGLPSGSGVDPTKPYGGTVTTQSVEIFRNGVIPLVQGSSAVVDYLPTDAGSNFVSKLISGWTDVDAGTVVNNYFGGTKAIDPDNASLDNWGYGFEYMRMDCFIAFLNIFFNVKDHRKNCVTPILIPEKNQFLYTQNTLSIDPTTAVICNNVEAPVCNLDGATPGFKPILFLVKKLAYASGTFSSYGTTFQLQHHGGKIKNIYLNVFKLIEIYKSKSSNGTDVDLLEYLQDVLNHVTKALGGINDFQLHTTKSSAQIIDVRYLEGGAKNNKFTLGVFGLNNICRDVKMTSRIFESQSTMIGIAAQNNNNVGDIYSETQISFNKGLKDRLLPSKTLGKPGVSAADWKKELQYLSIYIRDMFSSSGVIQKMSFESQVVDRVYSTYRSFLFQLDSLGKKAIIPFELELTVDGIGGIIIGQIFRIDVSLLPDMYHNSDVGFIVTGLTHKLDKNDWTTTIKAQICLMD